MRQFLLNIFGGTIMMNTNRTHIWEGSVGVRIDQRRNKQNGQSFFTFEPVRCFKRDGQENFEYTHTFTEKNAEALGVVLAKALNHIREATPEGEQVTA